MKVYQVKLTLGKETQYSKEGKLKNQVINPKFDEFELANMLEDQNWKKIGACEIECISCIDYTLKTKTEKAVIVPNKERMDEVNKIISDGIQAAKKPKTAAQQLKDQSEMMAEMAKQIEELKKVKPEIKSEQRAEIEDKANELGIKFRDNIGDSKLLEKIQSIEPEFKNK